MSRYRCPICEHSISGPADRCPHCAAALALDGDVLVARPQTLRRPPYIGSYWAEGPGALEHAKDCGNFVIASPTALLHSPFGAELLNTPLNVVLQLHIPTTAIVGDDPAWVQQLHHIYAGLHGTGLWPRLVGILAGEEMYDGLRNLPEAAPLRSQPVMLAKAIRTALDKVVGQIKAVFPGIPVGQVDLFWSEDESRPEHYRPIPRNLDFVGVDPYIHAEQVTAESFARQVVPFWAASLETAKRLGKPVLLVPQAFGDELRYMPTAHQLAWWVRLAHDPHVVGIAWFCLHHPYGDDRNRGLTQHPDVLEAVKRYVAGAL